MATFGNCAVAPVPWLNEVTANPAWAFDVWFLNLFPRSKPFVANEGGYTTLNFIPTLGTMILGIIPLWSAETTGDWRLSPVVLYQRDYLPRLRPE